MHFHGTKIRASRPAGTAVLFAVLLLIVAVAVRAALRAGEAIAPVVTVYMTAVLALTLVGGVVVVAAVIVRDRRDARDAAFVQRKLAAELAAELPPPTVRVDAARTELPPARAACERLTEPERIERGLAALAAAERRRGVTPVDLDELTRRLR
jgi:hypothetical protein